MNYKPCPFCGADAKLKRSGEQIGHCPGRVWLGCGGCGVGFAHETEEWTQRKGTFCIIKKATARVTEKWNGRMQ